MAHHYRTAHFGITGWDDVKRRAKAAFKGEYQGAHIGFASLELMNKVLTPAGHDGARLDRYL
jgi:hypothetical protein